VSVSDNRRHRAYPALTHESMVSWDRYVRGAGFSRESIAGAWRARDFSVTQSDNQGCGKRENAVPALAKKARLSPRVTTWSSRKDRWPSTVSAPTQSSLLFHCWQRAVL